MRFPLLVLLTLLLLTACAAPTTTPRPAGPTATERPFPTFGPTRTPRPTPTAAAPADTPAPPATTAAAAGGRLSGARQTATAEPAGKIARADVPEILRSALLKAGVNNPQVYWFTFDEGDREVALMVQYASPLRWQPGYQEMLRAAKQTLGRYYLLIDPPLYTAFIAATDITGTSDTVARLRRYAPEKLVKGEIGEEDFLNNYFEPEPVVITCTTEGCTGKMATPFPDFKIPARFLTRTPTH